MNTLVLFDSLDLSKASNEDFYTTTEIIAERTGNGYKEISNLVRKYQEQLKKIAPLTWHFEKSASNHGRATRKIYHIIRTLLASTVTGLTKKQIQARDDDWRKEKTLLDLLTLEEMERYKLLEGIVIAMILAGSDYEPIKQAIKNSIATKKAETTTETA